MEPAWPLPCLDEAVWRIASFGEDHRGQWGKAGFSFQRNPGFISLRVSALALKIPLLSSPSSAPSKDMHAARAPGLSQGLWEGLVPSSQKAALVGEGGMSRDWQGPQRRLAQAGRQGSEDRSVASHWVSLGVPTGGGEGCDTRMS